MAASSSTGQGQIYNRNLSCSKIYFWIMYPLDAPYSGSESIAPNRFSKFYRKHGFLADYNFRPYGTIYGP